MLDPEIAQKLMSNKRLMKHFITFLREEADELNTIDDIETDEPTLVAIEIKARKLARGKLKDILKPLLNVDEKVDFKKDDYNA